MFREYTACGDAMAGKSRDTIQFGDFQTPPALAASVTAILCDLGLRPASVVEPTCGEGVFLEAALRRFPETQRAVGLEINPRYFAVADARIATLKPRATMDLQCADFFQHDWTQTFAELPEPILVIGNPPWVTASQLGALGSRNVPAKSNFQNRRGLDAVTGKANFDIAEWIVIQLIEWLSTRRGTIAMLLKTSVARKVLFHAWKEKLPVGQASMYCFDARKHFAVAVDACLLVCRIRPGTPVRACQIFDLETPQRVDHTLGYHNGMMLADIDAFRRHENLLQNGENQVATYRWRSGVKHDCARVMELTVNGNELINGLGETVNIEHEFVYPMLKGSGVANGSKKRPQRRMIVTQTETGQATSYIKRQAPRTWAYLEKHAELLDRRGSSIYRNRPRFSIFGVGPYAFSPWKIAICGLYKRLRFSLVGPRDNKPVLFDDTVYLLPCLSREEAQLLLDMLHGEAAQEFLGAFVFWDAKRPVTAELLGRLSLPALADELRKLDALLAVRPELKHALESNQPAGRLF